MKKPATLVFAIHDLNTWGGQDRSTLEIARALSHTWPTDVVSYSLEDNNFPNAWGKARFLKIPNLLRRPVFFKTVIYYFISLFSLLGRKRLVHSTGACSLRSDIIQVQFIHRAWRSTRRELPPETSRGTLSRTYHLFLESFDVAMEKLLFRPRKTYIAISKVVAEELSHHFDIRSNVHVIHHGVDPVVFLPGNETFTAEKSHLRAELGIGEDDLVVVFVGAYERKGLDAAIRAFHLLPASVRKKTKLLAIGGGDTARFRALANELGVGDSVVLVTPKKNIVPYYRLSDLFLLPTLYEPFGLVILEALSCGLPAVVSKCAGASELITDGVEGRWIQNPQDAQEIADHLRPLIENEELRKKMGVAARKLAENQTWENVAQSYAKVMAPLMDAR